ncbi:MAG: dephospho-CoA kinase [Thermoanaerobaculaceae bacterium]|nr:dephospho-CoA kinase [Thermoanaerobaculaceae bacterium]TAM56713.1 MAG: dephospho-CoA kinase [Acidobacteriota bacterium]
MLRVGLTGGVASGKSALAALLARLGAAACDADAIVAELYRPGGAAVAAVARIFGAGVVAPDGGVDRGALAAAALADPAARQRLEAAVHPLVRARVAAWLEAAAAAATPPDVAVVEAALLVETGSFRDYDRLVAVAVPEPARVARALAKGWPEAKVRRIVAAQASDGERAAAADYVVRNDGEPEALAAAARRLWALLVEDAQRLRAGVPLPPRRITI